MTRYHIPFIANLLILIPVAIPTLLRLPTDQGKFIESEGWRTIVGGFWLAIMVTSALALRAPERFASVLVIQVIYKATFLAMYALPRYLRGAGDEVPSGITVSFTLIVLSWPFLIPWRTLMG
ncbi:MAG: hypothetical protein SFX73_13530 [Kofleriaceae bacterium]|nr:hypothetical protein [Kofleriaceae bacterium]